MGKEKKPEPKYHAFEIPDEGMTTHVLKQPLLETISWAAVIMGVSAAVFVGYKLRRLPFISKSNLRKLI